MKTKALVFLLLCMVIDHEVKAQASEIKSEKHRPQIHFTPEAHWMNDPNGMVYYKGKYHLFYQAYPGGTKWGPMHWGHAASKDLVHWERLPLALYPDSLGYIFSGSAVVDVNNTSGLGKDGKIPIIAIFTHHRPEGEEAKRNDFQNQSLAYSLDEGRTWTKYADNPVLRNPGITDFRDPKVMWYEEGKKWLMTLATKDRITFYSSPDLKNWKKESEFGEKLGAHGGVWECPDLFPLSLDGKTHWVLLVSINPGAPNGGSGTQYFIGNFDGKTFTPDNATTRWIDYGTDNYAGITWSNTGNRKIFIGWMNNWQYANLVPTASWRGASTLPRELELAKDGDQLALTSMPVKELEILDLKPETLTNVKVKGAKDLTGLKVKGPFKLELKGNEVKNFAVVLTNDLGEKLLVGFDKPGNRYFIDRRHSGEKDFEEGFGNKVHFAPRSSDRKDLDITIVVDVASIEIFADRGLTTMTDVFFPGSNMNHIQINSEGGMELKELKYTPLKGIWKK